MQRELAHKPAMTGQTLPALQDVLPRILAHAAYSRGRPDTRSVPAQAGYGTDIASADIDAHVAGLARSGETQSTESLVSHRESTHRRASDLGRDNAVRRAVSRHILCPTGT